MRTVGVEEIPADIDNFLTSPFQYQSWLPGHHGHGNRLQVFLCGIGEKFLHLCGIHHNGHPLLGFGDRKLRSVKARILLWHLIQIHHKPVRQLSDGN